MIRTGWLAAFFVALSTLPCSAQMGGMGGMFAAPQKPLEEWTVKVETFGNQSVTGQVRLASVSVHCELGTYEIKPEKVKAIEFDPHEAGAALIIGVQGAQRNGTVITSTGEKISGVVSVPNSWKIDTELGTLTPDAQKLKSFTFVARIAAENSKPGTSNGGKPGNQPKPNTDPNNGGQKPNPTQPNSAQPGEPSPSGSQKNPNG